MSELGQSLERMSFMQLLLLLAFVGSYVLSLGAMLGSRWRRRAALAALLLAVGFAASVDPWVHGALLVAFVVAALGSFVVASWLLARLLVPGGAAQAVADDTAQSLPSSLLSGTQPPGDPQPAPLRRPKRAKLAARRAQG